MKKIEFLNNNGYRYENPTDDKYILLGHFIGQSRSVEDIQETINMLEAVKSGNKTWEEVIKPYNDIFLQIGYDSGYFKCNKNTAYFISDQKQYTTFEMPLNEVIDLLEEWKVFMG
ncbi:hypothetical protein ATE47_16120 [Chryseobacterium sp. IHB B 17019]|jgi:hypothetical protein|uniref:hypothetical protein n=1 Tax=Chryseobacterium sp. IHB B 17019 TaxID=1721091 RepID=UPI0007213241|nr:hypothetical protein [Chryseobacterium sp. IHB B 17019]ALR31947.1 hypothetical protein ATE47_16120 [Chryseobacterium sp. IHB B 17019]